MCGINGFTWQDEDLVQQMNKKIKHRGPDGDGFFVDEKISLGHVRLAIIDLSEKGHQPMSYKYLTITFNGEIYNFQEIKQELEKLGHSFASHTDTEVVLAAYDEWGEKCLQKLNGMFAFAIWNKNKQELFIARDRLGIKPFYYYHSDDKFIFSSEIKGLLEHKHIQPEVDVEKINFIYFLMCIPREMTIYKNVFQLPAGSCAIFKNNQLKIKKYWQVKNYKPLKNKKEIKKKIYNLLNDSVKKRMISDVPLGVFLSGGIDSSIIALLAKKNSTEKVKTFSVGFEVDQEFEKYNADFFLARKTAKFFNTDHHEVIIKKGQAREYLDIITDNLEFPNTMTTAIPCYWLSKYVKNYITVVLGGDGGDELFGGYNRYALSKIISSWQKYVPKKIRDLIPLKKLEKICHKNDLYRLNQENYFQRYRGLKYFKLGDFEKIIKPEVFKPEIVDNFFKQNYFSSNLPTQDFENYFMYVDGQTWLPDHSLNRTDKTTMAHAIEERVPILDHRLAELAYQIPSKYKVGFSSTKKIFKETFKEELPKFLFKQPKRGWMSPAAKWLRYELKDLAHEVLADDYVPESQQIFDLAKARELLELHIEGKRYNLQLLWLLITWQMWYKKHIQRIKNV